MCACPSRSDWIAEQHSVRGLGQTVSAVVIATMSETAVEAIASGLRSTKGQRKIVGDST